MMEKHFKNQKYVNNGRSFYGVKPTALKKVSGTMALLLILAMLTPVLAFAKLSDASASYNGGNITGSVYTDAYTDVNGATYAVYADLFDSNGAKLSTTQATYVSGTTYGYNFNFNNIGNTSVFYQVYLTQVDEAGNVVDSTYQKVDNSTGGNTGGNTGGGIGGIFGGGTVVTPSSGGQVSADSTGKVDATTLANALSNNTVVTVAITGDSASLPASALQGAKDGQVVVIKSDLGTYSLPLSVLKLDDLAKALGVSVADLSIKVTVQKVSGDTATALNSAASSAGVKLLTDAVDFNVVAVSKDGNSVKVDFGDTYVSRTLNVTGDVDTSNTTGVLYDPVAQTFSFVPSTFDKENGNTVATLKRNGNSIYTVASFNKSFTDIDNHWAKADIQLLANKMVINGMTDTTFAPDSNITRGEFAALVVRALGLQVDTNAASAFSDVTASDWYNGVVAAAAKAGLINGYEDGTFKANKQITREELSALVVRALKYAGVQTDVSADQQASLLAKYSDANNIVWAKAEIAEAINAGIIDGVTDTTIAPDKQATRAESATMLKRFLSKAGFIN